MNLVLLIVIWLTLPVVFLIDLMIWAVIIWEALDWLEEKLGRCPRRTREN